MNEKQKKETDDLQKSIEKLTFADDGMFQAVLHKPELCAELVERLLHVQIAQIRYPKLEKKIAPYFTSKGVRLDVYLKDSDKILDIEMQSRTFSELGKRTRYYQSMIDIDALMKGEKYSKLKDSYILFICKRDPFKDDKKRGFSMPCYTFKNVCLENSAVNLNDKALKVIYNASAYKKAEDPKIRDFLRFISTNDPGEDDFSNRLSAMVEKLKVSDKFKKEFNAMNLHDSDVAEEAAQNKAIEIATKMLIKKRPTEEISEFTGLTPEEILDLQMSITVTA